MRHVAQYSNGSLIWGEQKSLKGGARVSELAKAALNSFVNPYSPLVWFSNRKVNDYYNRVLTDIGLAEKWRDFY